MFVEKSRNREIAEGLWQGKPSGALFWSLDANWNMVCAASRSAGHDDPMDFMQEELGCLFWATHVDPTDTTNSWVDIVERPEGGDALIEYRSPAGVLSEVRRQNQIIKYKVETSADLGILVEMWRRYQVRPATHKYRRLLDAEGDKWPVVLSSGFPSAVQQLLQHETGVANFWHLFQDHEPLLAEAMQLWQATQEAKYRIMETIGALGYYQAENTSTTMISPRYYEAYSLEHIRQMTESARRCGARSLVHMCGLLHDLMPLIRRTGMNGIHSLTPPPVGNTEFAYAFDLMPPDFFALGRLGSLEWVGKSQARIVENLRRILPHRIYRERAFALLVTSDEAPFTLADLEHLRDAIEAFERAGN